jgi:hypothetical protein
LVCIATYAEKLISSYTPCKNLKNTEHFLLQSFYTLGWDHIIQWVENSAPLDHVNRTKLKEWPNAAFMLDFDEITKCIYTLSYVMLFHAT